VTKSTSNAAKLADVPDLRQNLKGGKAERKPRAGKKGCLQQVLLLYGVPAPPDQPSIGQLLETPNPPPDGFRPLQQAVQHLASSFAPTTSESRAIREKVEIIVSMSAGVSDLCQNRMRGEVEIAEEIMQLWQNSKLRMGCNGDLQARRMAYIAEKSANYTNGEDILAADLADKFSITSSSASAKSLERMRL
jgi:hypothetical protein